MAFIHGNLPDSIRGFFRVHPLRIESLETIAAQMELTEVIGNDRAREFLSLSQQEVRRIGDWFSRYRDEHCWPTNRKPAKAFYVGMGEIPPEDLELDDCDNCLELELLEASLSETDDSAYFARTRVIFPLEFVRYETDAIRKCRMMVEPRNVAAGATDELAELHYMWPCILTGIALGELFASDPTAFFFSAECFVALWEDPLWRLPLRSDAE